jgi:Protein of unknown function (DUF3276)
VAYDNNEKRNESVFSKKIKAGKRRTYFFDVKSTKASDYYLTITESVKRFDEDGYDRHKIFIYKEDFNKFVKGISETVDHIKTELMPNFDFDAFNHEYDEDGNPYQINPYANKPLPTPPIVDAASEAPPEDLGNVDVDKW